MALILPVGFVPCGGALQSPPALSAGLAPAIGSPAPAAVESAASVQHRLAQWRGRRYLEAPIYRGLSEPIPLTQRPDNREVREMLAELRAEHRDLDEQIVKLENEHSGDQVTIKRLKKQKLLLKDRITALEDQLTPDIIA
jgi:hypothetical protein